MDVEQYAYIVIDFSSIASQGSYDFSAGANVYLNSMSLQFKCYDNQEIVDDQSGTDGTDSGAGSGTNSDSPVINTRQTIYQNVTIITDQDYKNKYQVALSIYIILILILICAIVFIGLKFMQSRKLLLAE